MKKTYILTFAISLVVLVTVTVVALMILLPQQSTVIDSSLSKYDAIKKSDYVYEKTKDITKDALVHEYTITSEEMDKFRNEQKYVSGNSDPFTPSNINTSNNKGGNNNNNTNNVNNNTNNNYSSSTSTNNTNSNSNTSNSNTTQKITNSNGGQANPPSTNK